MSSPCQFYRGQFSVFQYRVLANQQRFALCWSPDAPFLHTVPTAYPPKNPSKNSLWPGNPDRWCILLFPWKVGNPQLRMPLCTPERKQYRTIRIKNGFIKIICIHNEITPCCFADRKSPGTPLSRSEAQCVFETNEKRASALLRCSLSGGDEGDRTPYLLNAIQALSRYTRKRTPQIIHSHRSGGIASAA